MEEKINLGEYIKEKRKEAGMTQKELAEKLYVSISAVSKWERDLSYPDITLVTSLCSVLNISEHELLTASDDTHQHEIQQQSVRYLKIINKFKWVSRLIYVAYVAALLPTFLWGLLGSRNLMPFFITLCAMLMVFSLLHVPTLVTRYRASKSFWCFYGSLVALLVVCRISPYSPDTHWLLLAILGVSLGLLGPFLPLVLKQMNCPRRIKKNKGLTCMAVDSVLIYLLVILGVYYQAPLQIGNMGSILLITTIGMAIAGGIFFLYRYTKLPKTITTSILIGILGLTCIFGNNITSQILFNEVRAPEINFADWYYCTDGNVGVIMIAFAVVFGIVTSVMRRKNK